MLWQNNQPAIGNSDDPRQERILTSFQRRLRLEASNAVESVVSEAKTYVQNSPVVRADETSFVQRVVKNVA